MKTVPSRRTTYASGKYSAESYKSVSIISASRMCSQLSPTPKESTFDFMMKHGFLQSSVRCPGPLTSGKCQGGCSREMNLKVTNNSKDKFQWCCHSTHNVHKHGSNYKVKDVKLSIWQQSWLVDSKLSLETILEFVYLWSQGFTHSEVMHELKLSKKTVTEWFMFFRESCIFSVIK